MMTTAQQDPQFYLARRFALMKSCLWFLAAAIFVALVAFTEIESFFLPNNPALFKDLSMDSLYYLGAIMLILSLRLGYAILLRKRFRVIISRRDVVIFSGVILRHQTCVPLSKITQVNIGRNILHFLFKLYYVEILFPAHARNNETERLLRIEGLTERDALKLQSDIRNTYGIKESKRPLALTRELRTRNATFEAGIVY